MNWGVIFQENLLKLFVTPTTVGFSRLIPTNNTYYILEQKRSSHLVLLRSQIPSATPDKILYADSNGEKSLKEAIFSLIKAQRSNPELNIQIIPVSIYHGRLPQKEKSWLRHLHGERWGHISPLNRFLQILMNGRDTLIQADEPLVLNKLQENDTEDAAHKAARVLRTHFQIHRRALIGPDLSHRRTLLTQIMRHNDVQQAIMQHADETQSNHLHAEQKSLKILDGIAADFSPGVARALNSVVTLACKRLYRNVEVNNLSEVRKLALDHQLIYLPCHRSHMDYVLLSWTLYRHGLMLPHVAAGDNLNIPLIGPLLRRGGAIFMRRRFYGDKLYYALYKTYLETMSHHGHALEYFIEGGRSRTGRLLTAKTGLLKMTVESLQNTPQRPVAIIPVWIGYDRVVESHSYQAELAGTGKTKESLGSTCRSASTLLKHYGNAYISTGKPILLADLLDPAGDSQKLAEDIGRLTLRQINHAAQITPTSLIATALLSNSKQTIEKEQLKAQINALQRLLKTLPNLNCNTLINGSVDQWLTQAEAQQQITRQGDRITINERQAQALTFYRNNIIHLLALPGLYLLLARRLEGCPSQTISRLLTQLYPVLDAEVTLPWPQEALTEVLRNIRDQLQQLSLLKEDKRRWYCIESEISNLLAMTVEPLLLRYYSVLRVIDRYEYISREDLIDVTRRLARRIHAAYGFRSQEYDDPRVISSFIDQAIKSGILAESEGGISSLNDPKPLFRLARKVLRPHLIIKIDEKLGSPG